MTVEQKKKFKQLLHQLGCTEFHHGDCIGADADAHKIARSLNVKTVVIHPPDDTRKQANCVGDQHRIRYPYLARNKHIVEDTELLIATPKEMTEQLRSGTWSTIRYAGKLGRRVITIYPGGGIDDCR